MSRPSAKFSISESQWNWSISPATAWLEFSNRQVQIGHQSPQTLYSSINCCSVKKLRRLETHLYGYEAWLKGKSWSIGIQVPDVTVTNSTCTLVLQTNALPQLNALPPSQVAREAISLRARRKRWPPSWWISPQRVVKCPPIKPELRDHIFNSFLGPMVRWCY